MPRKKKTETEVKPMEIKIEEIPKIKISEFMEFAKGATNDEIKQYIRDNNLLWRFYVPYNEQYSTAAQIVQDTCYRVTTNDVTGEIVDAEWSGVDYGAIRIHLCIHSFTLYMDLDYENIDFITLYDFLVEYGINQIVRDIIAEHEGVSSVYALDSYADLDDIVSRIIDDTVTNRRMDNFDNIERIADSLEAIQDSFKVAADAIASIIEAFNNGVTEAATSPDVIDTISSEIVNRMKEIKD